MSLRTMLPMTLVLAAPLFASIAHASAKASLPDDEVAAAVDALVAAHGEKTAERARLGVRQVAERWWPEDGDAAAFRAFVEKSFVADDRELAATFRRLSDAFEQIDGHLHEVRRDLTTPIDLDTGPIGKADDLLANLDLGTLVDENLFRTKVAFLALLNFPVHTLADRLKDGPSWDRETWARSRLMDRFAARVPSEIDQRFSEALTAASRYIDEYDIRMERIACADGKRPFPDGKPLITHWGLRDELKSHYGAGAEGLAKQRTIQKIMERIIRQEIPDVVIANPDVQWCPETNEVRGADGKVAPDAKREPDTRYERMLATFRAAREADPYVPTAPTYIQRRFEMDRQIPEKEVEALLVSVLSSPEVKTLGKILEKRLGRKLEPFDIWYAGFSARSGRSEAELDAIVKAKYADVPAFQKALPDILKGLGFTEEKARFLSERIVVDPSRGAGHAAGAVRREDRAHLRTRIPAGGMLYKGYNIAIHELGHNVEQVFSLNGIDHWTMNGVPNNGFTEALAFVFQERDLELLGLGAPDASSMQVEALKDLWATYEIGGVALVDMRVWRWMYENPDATPAELREATIRIAKDVWNDYFAPVFGTRDVDLLAIYSHMISYPLYLSDYPLGHIIAFQLAEKLRGDRFASEFERVSKQGRLTPDAWMRGAVGSPISAKALLEEAKKAMAGMK